MVKNKKPVAPKHEKTFDKIAEERKILRLLQSGEYCYPKITEIAKRLKRSPATILRRVKELEKKGVIKEYVAHVDPQKLGKNITAFVRIQIEYPQGKKMSHEELVKDYIEYFKRLPEVQEIHIPLGTWDFVLKVKTRDIQDQYRFISEIQDQYRFISEKLMPLGTIRRMESLVMMRTFQEKSYVNP